MKDGKADMEWGQVLQIMTAERFNVVVSLQAVEEYRAAMQETARTNQTIKQLVQLTIDKCSLLDQLCVLERLEQRAAQEGRKGWNGKELEQVLEELCGDRPYFGGNVFINLVNRQAQILRREVMKERRRRRKAEKQLAFKTEPGFIMVPTKTRGLRGKPQTDWKDKIYAEPAKDERGHSIEGYNTVNVPFQEGVAMVYQAELDLNGSLEGKEIAARLELSARTLGWGAFDEKMFDICVLFAGRHPERSGAFIYDPADFGKLLFPGRERLSKQDYDRMHLSITKFTEQRYNFTLPDQFELKDFRIVADYGRIIKKNITVKHGRDRREESVEVFIGGLFQIFGGIWKDIENYHQLAPVETRALGLPDQLYPINRAIKFYSRMNWKKKKLRETKVCRIGLRTLINRANISISTPHEKRTVEQLHNQLDELVKEGMYIRWWIEGARGGGTTPKTWYKKISLYRKKDQTTRWERMDKNYCFLLTDRYIGLLPPLKTKKDTR